MDNKYKNKQKFIFITGGVSSSLGKGLASASIGALLERRGIKVGMLKMDPYINIDPGTMGPTQHGEVFVTDDGAETDLDLGHYERFMKLTLSRKSNFTTGQVYMQVIENERKGAYLGKTVQVVPHITNEIKRRIHLAAEGSELLIAEIGGTTGDIESQPFLEAIRQFGQEAGRGNVLYVHLVLLPYLNAAGEIKSKPAQHSVKELRLSGFFPDIIVCRSDREIGQNIIDKISLFCNISPDHIFSSIDLNSIYKLPLNFHLQGLDRKIIELLDIWAVEPKLKDLEQVVYNFDNPMKKVKIGIVGKYTDLIESYKSLDEALKHGAISHRLELELVYINAGKSNPQKLFKLLEQVQGILVPGGFGARGIEEKTEAIKYAREHNIPFFGICLGMQLAVVEFARNQAGISDAVSEEFDSNGSHVIHYMKGQSKSGDKGGTMRLGAYPCHLKTESLAADIYGTNKIDERHRHRLELNNHFLPQLEERGLLASGLNPQLNLVEVVELKNHPYFIACQYHPEFKSRPFAPHPLFSRFVLAASETKIKQ